MTLQARDWLAIAGVAVGVIALIRPPAAIAAPAPSTTSATTSATGAARMTPHQVEQLAAQTIAEHGLNASVAMLVSMAKIESDFRPDAIGDRGHALGLMQLSRTTAQWLAGEMGYHAWGRSLTDTQLLTAGPSMYLGAAYVDHLSRYRGVARSEQWIVRAYNGGPGWDLPADHATWQKRDRQAVLSNTLRHWTRYQAAKAQLGFA